MERGKIYKCVLYDGKTVFVALEGGEKVFVALGSRLRVSNICAEAAKLLDVPVGSTIEGEVIRLQGDHLRLECNSRLPLMTFMGGQAEFALV